MYQDLTKESAPTENAPWRIKLSNVFVETDVINFTRCDELGNRLVVNSPGPTKITERSLDIENEGAEIFSILKPAQEGFRGIFEQII